MEEKMPVPPDYVNKNSTEMTSKKESVKKKIKALSKIMKMYRILQYCLNFTIDKTMKL